MPFLTRADGPECPNCGCRQSRVIQRWMRWGKPMIRYRCQHCGILFTVPVSVKQSQGEQKLPKGNANDSTARVTDAVIYRPIRCPFCGSANTKTTSSRQPIRYHKCHQCGKAFKSVEED